ncbi:MarR family winged helix-turn-helix transcriptional regulator [Chondrinema litorale]|uniref:MarR family winged helix-turn-helix transcriptional regulator n=1 Tax=Chondrinema litorale TaxID=2994555 RepID=UPI002543B8F0|nr:MarR family transcriptional regulator [Chondrinema litorale]UZR95816.1 MarR family transcriptional regulator [Chondrinema litorale]
MTDNQQKKKRSVDFSIKAAWLAISKMYNYVGADFDITHSSGFVLLNIDREVGTPATKIAPLLGMEARSLTRMLKSIEEKGLIYRKADATDKRKVIIFLTEEGKKKRELARQTVKYFNRKLSEQVNQNEFEVFFKVIEKIHYVIENLDESEAEEEILGNTKVK